MAPPTTSAGSSSQDKPTLTPQTLHEEMEVSDDEDDKATKEELIKLHTYVKELREFMDKRSDNQEGVITHLRNELTNLREMSNLLGQETEGNKKMYREHIEHTAALTASGKDPGEVLKPRQPETYDGSASTLQGFLTQLRAYHMYFPTQFNTDELKVRHATSFLKSKALQWFEPIMRDYVNNPPDQRKVETRTVYANYLTFEKELKDAFGLMDEKRAAEMAIQKLKQTTSTSSYAAEYRNLASRLEWGEQAHMAGYYSGLKDEVKDALVGVRPAPKTFNELVALTVEIDDRQFERRKEKSLNRKGATYTPDWKKKNNQANQGKKRYQSTAHGTHSGPMELGVIKRDKKDVTCFNCGKKGHYKRECRSPAKEGSFRKLPEGKKNLGVTNATQDEPQTAKRSVTLGMIIKTRDAYDTTGVPKPTTTQPFPQESHTCKGRQGHASRDCPRELRQTRLNPRAASWEPKPKDPLNKERVARNLAAAAKDNFDPNNWILGYSDKTLKKPTLAQRRNCDKSSKDKCDEALCEKHPAETHADMNWMACIDDGCGMHRADKINAKHDIMSWTACYDDNCLTHRSEKEAAGWSPQRPKQDSNTKEETECWVDHYLNCGLKHCPKHAEDAQTAYERCCRMAKEGFHFPTQTGGSEEDRTWYQEERKHNTWKPLPEGKKRQGTSNRTLGMIREDKITTVLRKYLDEITQEKPYLSPLELNQELKKEKNRYLREEERRTMYVEGPMTPGDRWKKEWEEAMKTDDPDTTKQDQSDFQVPPMNHEESGQPSQEMSELAEMSDSEFPDEIPDNQQGLLQKQDGSSDDSDNLGQQDPETGMPKWMDLLDNTGRTTRPRDTYVNIKEWRQSTAEVGQDDLRSYCHPANQLGREDGISYMQIDRHGTGTYLQEISKLSYLPSQDRLIPFRFITLGETEHPKEWMTRIEAWDDPRLHEQHKDHDEIAWISCISPRCRKHRQQKLRHDIYPIKGPGQDLQLAYRKDELEEYDVRYVFRQERIAVLQESRSDYPDCKGRRYTECPYEDCTRHMMEKAIEWQEQKALKQGQRRDPMTRNYRGGIRPKDQREAHRRRTKNDGRRL